MIWANTLATAIWKFSIKTIHSAPEFNKFSGAQPVVCWNQWPIAHREIVIHGMGDHWVPVLIRRLTEDCTELAAD